MRFSALALLPLLTLAVACDNGSDDEDTGPIIIDTDTGEPAPEPWTPSSFGVAGTFYYNPTTGMAETLTVQGQQLPTTIVITIGNQDADWNDPGRLTSPDFCTVQATWAGPLSEADWSSSDEDVYFGVDLPIADASFTDNCTAADPTEIDAVVQSLTGGDFGLSVRKPFSDTQAEIDKGTSGAFQTQVTYVNGAELRHPIPGGTLQLQFAVANQVDDGELILNGQNPVLVEAADVWNETDGLREALYSVQNLVFFTLQ